MAINLNITKPTKQVETALRNGYLYKDIQLDLATNYTNNKELFKDNEKQDLAALYDLNSVTISLKNILTTSPGEKILNPTFGLDLRNFLFESVSETKGYFLGQQILRTLPQQEPRIKINNIFVIAKPDDQEYEITLNIDIPTLNISGITLKGVLNNDGYVFV